MTGIEWTGTVWNPTWMYAHCSLHWTRRAAFAAAEARTEVGA